MTSSVFGNIVQITPFMDNGSIIRNDTSDMFYSYFFHEMHLYDFNVLMKYGTIYATAEQMRTTWDSNEE